METIYFVQTPFGKMGIAEEDGFLTQLLLRVTDAVAPMDAGDTSSLLKEAQRQLAAYFAGSLKTFDLPLKPKGTPFQMKVWTALGEIAYGETASYGQIACRVGSPRAARAVGMANNRNPLPIFIPCHRIIGASGALTGYGGGLDLKQSLLELERIHQ